MGKKKLSCIEINKNFILLHFLCMLILFVLFKLGNIHIAQEHFFPRIQQTSMHFKNHEASQKQTQNFFSKETSEQNT